MSMLRSGCDYLRHLPVRLKNVWRLAYNPKYSRTYYPEEERKTKFRIFLENLWWLVRHQEVNRSYYMYGFDRRRGFQPNDYLSEGESRKLRNGLRAEFARRLGGYRYEALSADKFLFGQYLQGLGFPTPRILGLCQGGSLIWLAGEARTESLESILTRDIDAVLKDCAGLQGTGVLLFAVRNGRLTVEGQPTSIEELRRRIKGNWLIQERLVQHPEMSRLYPHSINTIRIVTVMPDDQPFLFCANGRMGTNGRTKDNWSIGGITVAVDLESGRFGRYGYYKPGYGTRVDAHPDTGVRLGDIQVPFWREATRLVLDLHRMFYGFHSLGWDVAFTESGPTIVESNHDWLLTFMQAAHGGLRQRFLETAPLAARSRRRTEGSFTGSPAGVFDSATRHAPEEG